MERRLQFERLISTVSSHFVGVYDLDESINSSLKEIGKFSGADRSYLFLFSNDGEFMSNTHEWCKEGVEPQIKILQDIASESLPWWTGKLRNHEIVHIIDVNKLPPKAKALKELLKEQEIKSLLVFPIFINDQLIAFIGFDNVTDIGEWKDIDFELLNMVSEIIGNALHRERILRRLEESQKKFKKLAANASDAIIIINKNNRITFWNKCAEEMFQHSKEEVINKHLTDIVIPDKYRETYIQKFTEHKNKAIKPWTGKTKQIVGKKRDGTEFPVEVSHSEINIEGGWHGVSIIRDLSERKEFEKLMRIKDKALETSLDAIVFSDLKGIITYINQSFLSMWGFDNKDEIIGRNSRDFWVSKEDANRVITSLEEFGYWNGELEAKRKDKTIFYVEVSASMVYDYNSEPICMMGIFRDITEKKRREKIIEDQNKKFRLLFKESPHMIAIFNTDLEIMDLNPALLEFIGSKREDLVGKKFRDIKLKDSTNISLYKKKLRKLFKKGKVEIVEVLVPNKDGEKRWLEMKGSLINLNEEKFVQIIMQDITDRKNLQTHLRKMNEFKTYILRKTCHELKTPLISIKGFTDLILQLHNNELSSSVINYAAEIKKGSNRLEKLVQDILKSSKLDSHEFELDLETHDIIQIVNSAVEDIRNLANKRDISLSNNTDNQLFAKVDKERIYAVILNLLSNAIKYTPKGGKVVISSKKEKDNILISVRDNGIGFTEKEKKSVFKQFGKIKRSEIERQLESEGSGLGLYIAKRIIDLHHGKINFTSEGRNKGTTFTFSLPIEKDS